MCDYVCSGRLKQALEKRKTKGGSKQRRKKTSGEGEGGSDEDSSAVISLREEEAKLEKEKADILKNQELVQEVWANEHPKTSLMLHLCCRRKICY